MIGIVTKLVSGRDSQMRLANLALRLASLVGKFGLSLFVARFLNLSELGIYGIVFAISMFMVAFIGGRIDYELCRRIALDTKEDAARLLRDQTIFFFLNFLAVFPFFVVAGCLGMAEFGLPIALCTWAICCLESYSNLLFVNTYALGRPLIANFAFFVRSGLWAFMAMAALFCFPGLRTLWTVLLLWIAGSALSIVYNLSTLDFLKWPSLRHSPVGWGALRKGLEVSFLIWIGSIGLAGGTYFDRIVLSAYLDLRTVGVATFYASFGNSVVTLVASSCLAVALPKLMRLVDQKDWIGFWRELRSAGWSICLIGLLFCIGIAIIVPYSAFILQKPEIYSNRFTLWFLMGGAMLRIFAEGAFFGLYVLRLDVSIWTGNIAFLVLSLAANICFIAIFGMIGLGIANILIALFLLAFRLWRLRVFAKSGIQAK